MRWLPIKKEKERRTARRRVPKDQIFIDELQNTSRGEMQSAAAHFIIYELVMSFILG